MKTHRFVYLACVAILTSSTPILARTLEFQTTQATAADVTVSPDGHTLVFTLLGHLFSMPSNGGVAEQLTFGPSYDANPAFSPDGSQIVFNSDRDGGSSNLFVIRLKDRHIVQLTHEDDVVEPAWSPDGKTIAFKRRAQRTAQGWPSIVARISASGGQAESVSIPAKAIGSVFFFPDGRLGWSVIEHGLDSDEPITRIEVLDLQGSLSTLPRITGLVDSIVPNPNGDGLYCHRITGKDRWIPSGDDLVFAPTSSTKEQSITPTASPGRFDIAADGRSLYLSDQGQIWKVLLPLGIRQALRFQAQVKLEAQEISKPGVSSARDQHLPRSILYPRLSPDGKMLVFTAAGFLWRQDLKDIPAQRISTDDALESEPSFSPDGHELAYVRTEHGEDSLLLLDFASGKTRCITTGAGISEVSWSQNGDRILAQIGTVFDSRIVAVNTADGKNEQLATAGSWSPRPQLTSDGKALYYSANESGVGNLYRLALSKEAKPEQITHLKHHLSDARVSADGKWILFRRNYSIMMLPFANDGINDDDVQELSAEGGDSFALTPDGLSVIYAVAGHVWRQSLKGRERTEIPIHLELPPPAAPPLLLRGVRVLDLASGKFSQPTSLYVAEGRIARVGAGAEHGIARDAHVMDASGRFAIPGLWDLHVHSVGANAEAFLAYGVTGLRDTGGWLSQLVAFEDRSESTRLPMPRYFYSGEIFEGDRPYWGDGFLQLETEKDAREYVRRFKSLGASFIKVYPSLSWPLKRAVADEAHKLGLPVVGHGMSVEEIVKSVTLGFFSIEHTLPGDPPSEDVLKMLAVSGTRWDPTVAVMGGDSLLLRDKPELLTDAKFTAFTPSSWIDFANSSGYNRSANTSTLRGNMVARLASIEMANRAGVKLMVGTDAPNPEVFYGSSLHWEMQILVKAGLSPIEVLRLATRDAAAAVGAEDLGEIAPGKRADIVLLGADPLQDIRNAGNIWRVMKAGWVFDPANLAKKPPAKTVAPNQTAMAR